MAKKAGINIPNTKLLHSSNNLLVHNRDDHAKNFSFMLHDNSWKLSPAYDLTYSFGPGGEHSTMYMGEGKILQFNI